MSALVCILTAGKGSRMGAQGEVLNKALLPLRGRAIISHIIEHFPADTRFVIALGYRGDQVRAYLKIAHPTTTFTFVDVPRYEGPGTGPGLSLAACESQLQEPFYFVAADTLFAIEPTSISRDRNWIGVAEVPFAEADKYCCVGCSRNEGGAWIVESVHDKKIPVGIPDWFAFTGLAYFRDFHIFFEALRENQNQELAVVLGELQISSGLNAIVAHKSLEAVPIEWTDVGTEKKYIEALTVDSGFNFGKTGEHVYVRRPFVIKFFADEKIAKMRTDKVRHNPGVFPALGDSIGGFYSYRYADGMTLYEDTSIETFQKLLPWLEANLWISKGESGSGQFDLKLRNMCRKFYREKTEARIADYLAKDLGDNKIETVDGAKVRSIEEILKKVPWDQLDDGRATFIHGDLQPDNILYDRARDAFVLLDWRHDFAGETSFGDIHYDFAKLYGGLLMNYREIREGRFKFHVISDSEVRLEFSAHPEFEKAEKLLVETMRRSGVSFEKVEIIVGLIFFNMAPLHHPPFDRLLFSLGRKLLTSRLWRQA